MKLTLIIPFGLFLFYSTLSFAQISIVFPKERMVYQRNNTNQSVIHIAGNYISNLDSVRAKVNVRVSGQGTSTNWQKIQNIPSNGYYYGTITAIGGWYRLLVEGYSGGVVVDTDTVERVGIGEVFAIAGQSNAQGGASVGINATDDRVSAIDYSDVFLDYKKLPIGFSKLDGDSATMAPFHYVPWCWGKLGDLLTQNLNVPVLFYGAAHGGTSSEQWSKAAQGLPFSGPSWILQAYNAPYRALEICVSYYASLTGMRAVLWHQGESDPDTPSNVYKDNILNVINQTRYNSEHNLLAWVVARASVNPSNHPNVIDGQNALINEVTNVFAGPNTDFFVGSQYRSDGIHLDLNDGLVAHANGWANALNTSFFSNSTPLMASEFIPISISCNSSAGTFSVNAPPGYNKYAWSIRNNTPAEALGKNYDCCNQYTFQPPASYESFNWTQDSTAAITNTTKRFMLNVRKTSKKVFFGVPIDFSSFTFPTTPSITANAAQIRPNDNIMLTATNCANQVVWSSTERVNPLVKLLTANTTFTAVCQKLVCASSNSNSVSIVVSSCFSNALSLNGAVTTSESPYKSPETITSTQAIDAPLGKINYSSGKSILLNPGFNSANGTVFKAEINGCN